MQKWLRVSLLLCVFGFFREFRPSEPFVTEYLTGPYRNFTTEQVNKDIYPFGTYSILAQLVVVFLITDILRYKPIIVVSACAGIVLFAMLLWTQTIWEMRIAQVFFGTFMATEVAYYTYIYAKVEKERYQIVTGHTRSAILCGKFLGGVVAQGFVSAELMSYRDLHYFSFATQIISLFIALFLPSVRTSLYFYTEEKVKSASNVLATNVGESSNVTVDVSAEAPVEQNVSTAAMVATANAAPTFSWRNAFQLLWEQAVSAYTNRTVVRWSLWWALATCGQLQVISYVQFLWKEIDPDHQSFYNGGVEAAVTLLGAAGAMTAGMMNSSRHKEWHSWILTICSLLMGVFLVISAITHLIWISYAMYILFGICYFFVITVASAVVAENLSDDSFGLIFGINTLLALTLQTILTLVVVTDTGYGLGPREQFVVYGCYFVVLAFLYFSVVVSHSILRKLNCCGCGATRIKIIE